MYPEVSTVEWYCTYVTHNYLHDFVYITCTIPFYSLCIVFVLYLYSSSQPAITVESVKLCFTITDLLLKTKTDEVSLNISYTNELLGSLIY